MRFMNRLRSSLASSEDGKPHDDPIDSSFFLADQNGKSSYLLLKSMVEQVETDIHDYQYVTHQECAETLIVPLNKLFREVEAVDGRIQTDKAIAESLEHMDAQAETADAAMSVASSNITQDPVVEPCSLLDPNMDYYCYSPTDEELLAQSLKLDQQIMNQ